MGYWQNVDLYVGGAEHGTGHLIYARFWNKFLFDIGLAVKEEPFQKLINQGMIQGRSNFVYRSKADNNLFVSKGLVKSMDDVTPIHVDINIVDNDVLDVEKFRQWRPEFADARFELEDGKYVCGWEVEKMSKSMFNVQNPDDLVARYGADTLRLYEMFLGPVEQAKPWDTNGIEGVHRFLKKFWRLFEGLSDESAAKEELKVLHQTIKKITDDVERFSFNTCVSTFMICANTLTDMKCGKREVLEPLAVLMAPFAPAYRRGAVAPAGPRGVGVRCAVACVRRPLPGGGHCEVSRAVQRQDALHGGPAGHLYAGRGHCRHQGHARGAEVDGRQGTAQGDICSQEDYQYRTINVKQTFLKKQSASGDIRQPDGRQGCHTGMQGF